MQGSTATLAVTEAATFGSSQSQVLLTTAPQQAVPHVLKVGDSQGTSGTYMDPTANTIQLTGSTVTAGPMLLSATADGDTKVVLTFDSALDPDSATELSNYTSTPDLFITSATLQSDNKQVVLTTGPQYQMKYSIVANVTGPNGEDVNPAFNSASFTRSQPSAPNDRR